jgi:nucleotide-binding universal stress UspA family protein
MKNILVHIHEDSGQEDRLQVALQLARAASGHLICLQITPLEYYGTGDFYGGMYALPNFNDAIRKLETAERARIEAILKREDVSWEWRQFDGNVAQSLISQSRMADVVVLSQEVSEKKDTIAPLPIVGTVAIYAGAPVIVVPQKCTSLVLADSVMIAWNGSAEAAHALRSSLPLLKMASSVHIVSVSSKNTEFPAIDASTYLSRHGVKSELHDWPAQNNSTSVALLAAVHEIKPAYLVMGAYGHSRLRETILGGVTFDLLRKIDVPLLLAH